MGGCGALRRWGCAWTYERTQFLCVKFRLGSTGEPTICSHCYSVPYMKIPANNQVFISCDQAALRTLLSVCPPVRLPHLFTRGLRVLSLPVSVNPELARTITHHAFKLEPWWWGGGGELTLTFKVKFDLKCQIYPILSLSMP